MKIINITFWIVAFGSIGLDIISKQLVIRNLHLLQSVPIIPGVLHATYVRNSGAAFSLFQGQDWLRWLSAIVSLGLIWVGLNKSLQYPWEQLGLGLILAGAAGNGIDRWTFGSVIDFIDIRLINFAVFNWADISINVGLACLLIHTLFHQPQKSKSP
jgi:signal peptidase II